ncbi:hypothetical protein [Nocardia sp. NPDC058705]|uniref:hypothetical protein n=1 Tax=Nocardia sp. NPDC058705 TaxID=3346609 RepID=UPI0036BC6712
MTDYAALRALGEAIAGSVATVAAAAVPSMPGSDPSTLELLIALDDALSRVDELVAQVPVVVDAALAGPAVARTLDRKSAALAVAAEQVACARRTYDNLRATEEELVALGAEHEQITRRLAELDRLRALSAELPALREQQRELLGRNAALIAATEQAEQAMFEAAESVVVLSTQCQELLAEKTCAAVDELRVLEARWSDLNRDYLEAEKKVDVLRDEHRVRTAALAAHCEVDQDLLARLSRVALSGSADSGVLSGVGETLADAQSLLESVDQGLGRALVRYDEIRTSARAELAW